MKIIKERNGIITLTDNQNKFLASIPGGQYIHLHTDYPDDKGAVFISDTSNSQDYVNRLVIPVSGLLEVFGGSFSGDVYTLGRLLATNLGTASTTTSINNGTDTPTSTISAAGWDDTASWDDNATINFN